MSPPPSRGLRIAQLWSVPNDYDDHDCSDHEYDDHADHDYDDHDCDDCRASSNCGQFLMI